MKRNAKNGFRFERDLNFEFPLWCGFMKLGEGGGSCCLCLRNTYVPTRPKPERHRLNWRDRNCSAPFQVISRFSSTWIMYSPLQPTSQQHLCISHSVSATEVSDVNVVKLIIWNPLDLQDGNFRFSGVYRSIKSHSQIIGLVIDREYEITVSLNLPEMKVSRSWNTAWWNKRCCYLDFSFCR
jgi:hypothetical protein